ncbi:MAG TPA: tRNA 2-thiouridine(34) synthase MnmA [bacterium]|nr:tRNA 2-thiouridine(34) synthase MnmA [bacterium]
MARVAVAMSGGVDSAVAAALMVEAGHDVVGFTMNLWPAWVPPADDGPGCCGLGAIDDARAVARTLAIPHYVLNLRDAFERAVIQEFAGEYARGRTPNPCIACNRAIKFALLLERVRALGMERLATGHYARIEQGPDGAVRLLRAVDRRKDQSYVLAGVARGQLAQVEFPVGAHTKPEIRAIARRFGLRVADKADSQEICFVPRGDHSEVVARYAPDAVRPGPVFDGRGRQIGEHRGIARYTVGQRRGLGGVAPSSGNGAASHEGGERPRYVVAIDGARNALRVGDADELRCQELLAGDANWIAIGDLREQRAVTARIRHGGDDVPAVITPAGPKRVRVEFLEPPRAAAPGQAIAFYEGDVVVGGAVIDEVAAGDAHARDH